MAMRGFFFSRWIVNCRHFRGPSGREHPDLRARIDAARKKGSKIEQPSVAPNRYDDAISGILLLAAELEIEAAEFERAEATIDRHLARVPGSGRPTT